MTGGRDVSAPSGAADRLRARREALFAQARAGDLQGFPARLAGLMDDYFRARLAEAAPDLRRPVCLMAVGGYGRSELCPFSDIDLLVLFPKRIPGEAEPLARSLLFPLWDLGLDLGHGVRSVADCLSLARSDPQVLASLLDARHLAGDPWVFEEFSQALRRRMDARRARALADWLRDQNAERERQFGDASGLLEPDLKNGLGGLRGGHHIRWLTKAFALAGRFPDLFSPEEEAELACAMDFLLRTRTALHLSAGRHTDTLNFDFQPAVAELLGFTAPSTGLAVEEFLSALHRNMARIKAMRQACWRDCCPPKDAPRRGPVGAGLTRVSTGLDFADPSALAHDPGLALKLFAASAAGGEPVSWPALRAVRQALPALGAALAGKPGTLRAILDILRADRGPGQGPGRVMAESGLLAALLPEFGRAENLVQFDDYHLHPLGRHTLECVRILVRFLDPRGEEALGGCRWCLEAAGRLEAADADVLLLAGLFHDLAKGLEGDHSEVGADLVRRVLPRFGLAPEAVDDVAFLVRQHLLLPITATRRDLSHEGVVAQVAETVGTTRRLDLLALLAVADSLATGPRAWNDWTAALFAECFFKVRKLLTEGPLSGPDAARRILETRDKVRALARGRFESAVVERRLEAMPPRALNVLDPASVLRHLEVAERLEQALAEDRKRMPGAKAGIGVCVVEASPTKVRGYWELIIAARDRPGLFATLAGVLSLHGLDIHAAELFTWKDGTALDVFVVSDPPDSLFPDEAWGRVQRSIHYALTGKLSLDYRLEERRNSPLQKAVSRPRYKAAVHVDNEESDFYTRIEIKAGDRLGLLYDLASALHAQGLDIQLARIATSGGRVADVFYVRDGLGQKVEDPGQARSLEQALLRGAAGHPAE